MKIETFELERVQSLYENTVDYNLTESGFHPYTLKELLPEEQLDKLLNTRLGYGQTNGSVPLRESIARLYHNTDADNILVTNGSAEANLIVNNSLFSPGDEIVMMLPNYMQIWGLARSQNITVKPFYLLEDRNWAPDLVQLESLVTDNTKAIVLCHPNNPTGALMTEEEMQQVVAIAERCGTWIYVDEIYRGAELDGRERPSFYSLYAKVIVNGGLSKAYALPGLRLGWLVGPKGFIADSWAYHDYTSITAGILSNEVADYALQPAVRDKILQRNRNMLNENLQVFQGWIEEHNEIMSFVPPQAGGMAFFKYGLDINSSELSEQLRANKSVLVIAGDCFGMDNHLRIGIGSEKEYLLNGLNLISEQLTQYS